MFMSDISIIVRRMRTQAEHAMGGLEVGFPEQLVLMFLHGHGPSNQEAIVSALGVDKGAIAKTIAKLEAKDLVTRQVNPRNKREKIVSLAPKAHQITQAMEDARASLNATLFAGFTPEEICQTCALLERMAQNVSEDGKE